MVAWWQDDIFNLTLRLLDIRFWIVGVCISEPRKTAGAVGQSWF